MSEAQSLARATSAPLFRHSTKDAAVAVAGTVAVAAPLVAAALVPAPSWGASIPLAAVLALVFVWASNTVAHIHLHTPLFTSPAASRAFSFLLTVGLLVPQSVWRSRHLAHHAGARAAPKSLASPRVLAECLAVLAAGACWALLASDFALRVLAPAWAGAMALSWVSGTYEHRSGGVEIAEGVSTYGRGYNVVWFRDGLHAEHHAAPGRHWTELVPRPGVVESRLPPLLRWLSEPVVPRALCLLERLPLASERLAAWVVARHARALAALVPKGTVRRVLVVGGGLFPRSVLALREIHGEIDIEVLDRDASHLALAREELAARGVHGVTFSHGAYEPARSSGFDLVVFPLAFVGCRPEALCPALHHEWLSTRGKGPSARVSVLLFKKARLVA